MIAQHVSEYYQLDDLYLVRYKVRPPSSSALLYVQRDFRVQFKLDNVPWTYVVPAGTPTDFASIPQFAQSLVSKLGPHIEAAVVHDRLCIDKGFAAPGYDKFWNTGDWASARFKVSSETAAAIFLEAMLCGGTPRYLAEAMHRAVVDFGPRWS